MRTFYNNQRADSSLLLIVAAWAGLIVVAGSDFAAYLDHGDWTLAGVLSSICGVDLSEAGISGAFGLLGSWLLMVIAMMGPVAFANLKRAGRISARALFGYATAWSLAGIGFHGFGYLLQRYVGQSDWLLFNGWSIGALTLLAVGLFQFSLLKSTPAPICAMCHPKQNKKPFILGLRHGIDCIRCCGLLMCLMFVFFPGNLFWMALIAGLMVLDRGVFGLPILRLEIGVGLIVAAGVVTATQIS